MVKDFEEQHKGPQAVKDFVISLNNDDEQLEECEEEECEEEDEDNFEVDEAITPGDLSPATRAPTKKIVNSPGESPKTPCTRMEKSQPDASESTEITPSKAVINTRTCKPAWMKLVRLMGANTSCSMEVKKLFQGGPKET